jgi:hypothetical protein
MFFDPRQRIDGQLALRLQISFLIAAACAAMWDWMLKMVEAPTDELSAQRKTRFL